MRNLSNNTAMLRGLAHLFVHTPQSMHMPQPKIHTQKTGFEKTGFRALRRSAGSKLFAQTFRHARNDLEKFLAY